MARKRFRFTKRQTPEERIALAGIPEHLLKFSEDTNVTLTLPEEKLPPAPSVDERTAYAMEAIADRLQEIVAELSKPDPPPMVVPDTGPMFEMLAKTCLSITTELNKMKNPPPKRKYVVKIHRDGIGRIENADIIEE